MIRRALAVLATLPLCCAAAWAGTVNIDLVPVGDVMNLADTTTGYGAVPYAYNIGKYDVTIGQYAAFLTAVATTSDPYGLYNASMATATPTYGITQTSTTAGFVYAAKGNSANVPVTYVDWGDAARFCNWLA
ncbi:MAG TPA: SUMF1/EgtB/PvdO family nonheme iron enzyme, partial [Pirellulales bacterium]|nr:SUMF1/EgtB/PvdO family nonheme iron enzyme [Pirellulales bacterium]